MAQARILMDGAYAHLAACYKRTTDHCIAELNGCLTPGAWLKSSCLAGCFFQESLIRLANQNILEFASLIRLSLSKNFAVVAESKPNASVMRSATANSFALLADKSQWQG
jgi:hypothetical protein